MDITPGRHYAIRARALPGSWRKFGLLAGWRLPSGPAACGLVLGAGTGVIAVRIGGRDITVPAAAVLGAWGGWLAAETADLDCRADIAAAELQAARDRLRAWEAVTTG